MTLNIILAVLLIMAAFAFYRSHQSLISERRSNREYCEQLAQEIAITKARTNAIRKALETTGGIGKRIAECREIAETLQLHAPAVFNKEPGLIYWIEATDQFLVELHAAAGSDQNHERVAKSRSGAIYHQVHAETGLPLPPGELAFLSRA